MATDVFDFGNSLAAKISSVSMQAQVIAAVIPAYVAKQILAVKGTEYVYVKATDRVVRVWTVVDSPGEPVFDAIYDREKAIIDELNPIRFDFHVIAREGRPINSIVTLSCQGWRQTV
jgi:hypothetical protein